MVTKAMLDDLETQVSDYYMKSEKISFDIVNRQEELDGILQAYAGLRDSSAQVLRQYYLKEGVIHD